MKTPIILLVGQAGSGKDTVASFMVQNHKAVAIAQADPMKRLAKAVFGFTDDQLWGPSSSRNAPDPRYLQEDAWDLAQHNLFLNGPSWVKNVLPDLGREASEKAFEALMDWFQNVLHLPTMRDGKPLTCRWVLQTLGTEWGRTFSRDMWVAYAGNIALKLLGGGCIYDRARGLGKDPDRTGYDYVVITDGRFRNEVVSILIHNGATVRIDSDTASAQAQAAGVLGHRSETEQNRIPDHFYSAVFHNDKTAGLGACETKVNMLMLGLQNHVRFNVT